MTISITMTIAALLALFMFLLSWQVSMRRLAIGKSKGDVAAAAFGEGTDDTLRRRVRAFGNFIEYTPICLIMLAMAEYSGAGDTLMWSVGGLLIAGRIVHAAGMLYSSSPAPRAIGMTMTYPSFVLLPIWLLINIYG